MGQHQWFLGANIRLASDQREDHMSNLKIERVLEVAEADECLGFCTRCGAEIEGVEPNVRNYPCPSPLKSRLSHTFLALHRHNIFAISFPQLEARAP